MTSGKDCSGTRDVVGSLAKTQQADKAGAECTVGCWRGPRPCPSFGCGRDGMRRGPLLALSCACGCGRNGTRQFNAFLFLHVRKVCGSGRHQAVPVRLTEKRAKAIRCALLVDILRQESKHCKLLGLSRGKATAVAHPAAIFSVSSLVGSKATPISRSPAVPDSDGARPRGEVARRPGPPQQHVRARSFEPFTLALNQTAKGLHRSRVLTDSGCARWDGLGHGWGGSFIPTRAPKP